VHSPDAAVDPASVPYDCAFIAITPSECEPTEPFVAELDRLGAAMVEPGEGDPSAEECARAERALDRALAVDPSALTAVERIVAQSGALRVFGPRTCPPERAIAKKAAAVVARLALPAQTLDALGAEPMPDADEWLGPRAAWIDRRAEVPLLHETMEFFTQAFRPIRGRAAGVVSQLVAIDSDWRPHITPIVGRIEARRDLDPSAPACVGKLDAARLACASGRIVPVPEERLPRNSFVRRVAPGRVDCMRCHGSPDTHANLSDLDDGGEHLRARRARLLEEARAGIRSLRGKL
jgi:hypothetical protein